MEDAQRFRLKFMPQILPKTDGISLTARSIAGKELGSDYLDAFVFDDQSLVLAIGDVMGKGISSALLMAMVHVAVRGVSLDFNSPEMVLEKVNKILYGYLEQTESFITLLLTVYNQKNRELFYARAGHTLPLLYRAASEECEFLRSKGIFLGGKAQQSFEMQSIRMEEGDVLLLYTDGLLEAGNANGKHYGKQRLSKAIKYSAGMDAASIEEYIRFDLAQFTGNTPQKDDITMVILKAEQ